MKLPEATYVLTLDNEASKERLADFLSRFDDDRVIPFYGLDGGKEKIPSYLLAGRWAPDGDLRNWDGTKAVCYSHLMIMLAAMGVCAGEDEHVMVVEDDVLVHPEIFEYLEHIQMPDDWDFLHLSYWDPGCGSAFQQATDSPHISKVVKECCTGMFSYMVRPRKIFQRLMDAMPFTCEIDNWLTSERNRELFNIYVVEHNPWLTEHVSPRSLRKEIDDESWAAAQT